MKNINDDKNSHVDTWNAISQNYFIFNARKEAYTIHKTKTVGTTDKINPHKFYDRTPPPISFQKLEKYLTNPNTRIITTTSKTIKDLVRREHRTNTISHIGIKFLH